MKNVIRVGARRIAAGLTGVALAAGGSVLSLETPASAAAPASVSATSSAGTVESPPFVSADPDLQSGGCTITEKRATKRWWMFGTQAQLDFGITGSVAPKVGKSTGSAVEGSTVVTDTQGNLRFWSNGIDVWGADGQPILNSGGGLGKASSAQTVVAVPALGSPGKYYVVTSGYQAEMGTADALLYYSVIDMNANGGKGEMIQKNIPLGSPGVAGEGLTATENAAGDGFWVYSVAANSNQIYRWEFKANGPVSTTPQSQSMSYSFSLYSTMHFDNSIGSNRGVVLAAGQNIYTTVTVNRTTGALTEVFRVKHVPISGSGYLYGAAFSPSGRYMFFTELYGAPSYVYRVDLQGKQTAAELRDSRISVGATIQPDGKRYGGAVKLGPDGNIWTGDGYGLPNIVKIPNPDATTPGSMQRVRLDTNNPGVASGWGLPDMVTGCEKRVPQVTATVSAPKDLTLGDTVDPVTVSVVNTGNTGVTNLSYSPALSCPKTSLAPKESMICTAPQGAWGAVTQAQNDQGFVKGITYSISAKGSIGADPVTGLDRIATITVDPLLDLPLVRTHTMIFDGAGGTVNGATSIKRRDGLAWGALPGASRANNVFTGWFTATTGGTELTSGTVASSSLTAYARWRPVKFNIVFYGNAQTGQVTGSTASLTVESGCTDCKLPANGFTKTTGAPALIVEGSNEKTELNSKFLGWSLDPFSHTGDIADGAVAGNLSQTDGATVSLYAVWDDAPKFIIDSYPNRFFSLGQAKAGAITEAELLSTVKAADRETNPLEKKTSAQVQSSGSDVGVTVFDYDAADYTSLTDSGVVTLNYKVKDGVGNVAFLRIRVTVTNGAPVAQDPIPNLRGISSQYAGEAPAAGGLSPESLWLTDPARKAALAQALDGSTATTYCLQASSVSEVRAQIAQYGLGNSGTSDGLSSTAAILREKGMCP